MFSVYKYREYFIAGVNHVVPDYFQDVVFIRQQGSRWDVTSAERFRPQDSELSIIRDAVKFATHKDDLKKAVVDLRSKGIVLEEIRNFPFPRSLIEGKKKIQAEFD
ncbi:hypothetical protein [Metallosphaera hakonensis]|uniref:Uncharacterized protein n=1 Tax=Metallosphaera hakonensis JCM 8857 = DSM 7519 TaxID=1293036 RepID=A0A2U9IWB6_9CREN|nr:hypothetical protein [Metallosphaera hakonensis]AWS00188.1 hypothetical protein DFR87_11370 [Metallosphaera hakonensis JCM 8857 = DSM 7519]